MKRTDEPVERALREGPGRQPVPEGFAEGVMRRLSTAAPAAEGSPSPGWIFWLRPVLAGVAVLALALGFWFRPAPSEPIVSIEVVNPAMDSESNAETATYFSLPEVPTGALAQLPGRLEDPLEKELDLLISDARKAVNYLALNFLPAQEPEP